MTQEDKDLLLKDLCARAPYGVKVCLNEKETCILFGVNGHKVYLDVDSDPFPIESIKPYLRPMSSMTEEEKMIQRSKMLCNGYFVNHVYYHTLEEFDYLNSIHVDYRTDDKGKTMIEKGFALEASEGMYETKKQKKLIL